MHSQARTSDLLRVERCEDFSAGNRGRLTTCAIFKLQNPVILC